MAGYGNDVDVFFRRGFGKQGFQCQSKRHRRKFNFDSDSLLIRSSLRTRCS